MIVVGGEALFDVFAGQSTPAGLALDARLGGSPFNVAVGLARLGQPAAFFGGLSSDFLGDRLLQALQAEGVATDWLQRLPAPTTLSLVGLDAQGQPSYRFYGEGAADRVLPAAAADAVPLQVDALQLGSYAMVVEPVAGVQRRLVERLRGHALIAYDPNVRLNVEPNPGRWRAAIDWMAERADLLKISAEDLQLLYPGADPAHLVAQWRSAGVAAVVLTLGAEGARAWCAAGELVVDPVPVALVDTVGAGDTFQAALLTALAERGALSPVGVRTLDRAGWSAVLAFAARAAAITCGRRGADLPRRAELA